MSTKKKVASSTCRCCGVHHDPTICAQCQSAGCAANRKSEKCRLSVAAVATQKLSEHQLRLRVLELERSLAELTKLHREAVDEMFRLRQGGNPRDPLLPSRVTTSPEVPA